jgi:hypothetical protein
MVLCVAVTAIFQTTEKIGNAYGKFSILETSIPPIPGYN